jgi:hypothetical protein
LDDAKPPDETVDHVPSPRKYVVDDGVPVAEISLIGIAEI